jgi:hypothetical protein
MSAIDLYRMETFSVSPCGCSPCEDPALLFFGGGYQTFLTLQIPTCIGLRSLTRACLILFKLPNARPAPQDSYFAYPLCDYFSLYGYYFSRPRVDAGRVICFHDDPGRCALEIDVTAIARAWLDGEIENRGLMLCGGQNTACLTCASAQSKAPGMSPYMRLNCVEFEICQPLSVVSCAVSLN